MKLKYSDRLEKLEKMAYDENVSFSCSSWLESVGDEVRLYALECEAKNIRPTFKGLVESIEKMIN